ncbi:retrovirus-related Pol polyprotein from transposon opus [Trichonephila clavipes]|nr:retrovirus-related Pol polyprotein from transposon opus [Trichonephila clavipes]
MGPKKTIERIKYSFFWVGLRADVKKFCESCKECQLTRSVRIKDRPPITPVARPELPFQVVNMDLIGPIDPPSSKGHKYILCLVDQHTRWGEAVPLTSLSAKVACEAFVKLKELPCEVTSLATPDANLPFQVHCDASDYGVGCCLIQQDTEGIYRPIAFASQKFNATQKNWVSIEKEAWAVLYGLNKFDKWIYGAKVEIISDHNPLKYLNQTTPKSPKLTRWALALQRWNHPITHRPGRTRDEIEKRIWQRRRRKRSERKKRVTEKPGWASAEDKGCWAYRSGHYPDVVVLYPGCTPDSPLIVNPHRSLNSCPGMISARDFLCASEEEILMGLSDSGSTSFSSSQAHLLHLASLVIPPMSCESEVIIPSSTTTTFMVNSLNELFQLQQLKQALFLPLLTNLPHCQLKFSYLPLCLILQLPHPLVNLLFHLNFQKVKNEIQKIGESEQNNRNPKLK